MKGISLFLLISLFSNCNFIKLNKLIENQELVLSNNKIDFNIKENRIVLKNGVNFYLDLGAPNVIFKSQASMFNVIDSLTIGSLININGKKLQNNIVKVDRLNNKFFHLRNGIFRVLKKESNCDNVNGLIGSELFQDEIILLNFDNNYIRKIDSIKNTDINKYKKAKIEDFDGYYFYVVMYIGDLKIKAKIDTGSPYDILLKNDKYEKINDSTSNTDFFFKSGKTIDTLKTTYVKSGLDITNTENHLVISNKYIKRNLLGVGYLKKFNWIFDFKNGEIYYEPIKDIETYYLIDNKSTIKHNNLIFYQTNEKQNIQDLGKKIIAVEEKPVSLENQCELKHLLNSTNWNDLNITYK